jgi:hypothetical protein
MTLRDTPTDDAVLCQTLYRDDIKPLCLVMRYYDDDPTYAWVRTGATLGGPTLHYFRARRLGACSTDQAARSAVERALGEVGSRGGW